MSLWVSLIFWFIIITVIVLTVVKFTNSGQKEQTPSSSKENGLENLIRRYAEGKINRVEFEEQRKQLSD